MPRASAPLLDDAVVRLTMVLKLDQPGARLFGRAPQVLQALQRAAECARPCPASPRKVRSAPPGDLAPLAHMSAALLGEGHVRLKGRMLPAAQALSQLGLEPLTLPRRKAWRC